MTEPGVGEIAPGTRDLRTLLDALAIVEAECRFQFRRLTELVERQPSEYLARMASRYDEATGTLVTLRRYQEGRLATQEIPRGDFADAVDASGVATAHIEDEE